MLIVFAYMAILLTEELHEVLHGEFLQFSASDRSQPKGGPIRKPCFPIGYNRRHGRCYGSGLSSGLNRPMAVAQSSSSFLEAKRCSFS